jgi:chromosomal replication initiator protein
MATLKTYWPLVLEDLKSKVSFSKWQAWFSGIEIEKVAIGCKLIVLKVPSKFNKDYIEKKFVQTIIDSAKKYFPNLEQIQIIVDPAKLEIKTQDLFALDIEIKEDSNSSSNVPSRYSKETIIANDFVNNIESKLEIENNTQNSSDYNKNLHNLNYKFTFDNYVVAQFNELVVSVSKAILKEPGKVYNPLFIHSPTGLGKTHLIQAIGHKYLENFPNQNVKYISAETFLNHYVSSWQKGKSSDFRNFYRSVDLLLIDDIQFITGKTSTQEAFFHTFNELHQQNKQIILTSDKSPKLLTGIEQRLVSRFEWGMVVELNEPTMEDRLAIVKDKIARKRLAISDGQALQIASSVQTNIRDLEGLLNKIEAYIRLHPGEFLDQDILNKLLNPYLKMISSGLMHFSANSKEDKNDNFAEIFQAIGRQWMVNRADICSKKRDKNSVMARQALMYILHRYCEVSMATIGNIIGGRDHTTIVHGCQKIENLLKENIETQIKIRSILEELNFDNGLF